MRTALTATSIVVLALMTLAGCAQAASAGAATDVAAPAPGMTSPPPCTIVTRPGASFAEVLAAREIRRYVYLRTGRLLPIASAQALPVGDIILVRVLVGGDVAPGQAPPAGSHGYVLASSRDGLRRTQLVAGADPVGTLYAAYRLAEHLGVRFYLEGDVIPDATMPFAIPTVNETAKPLFDTRGIQPFHDFPEGPDWWNLDDYKAILSQLPKLRMNFFGLHTYPEGGPNAEPAVWIGLPQDVADGAKVKFAYPSSWQNTLRGNWGYRPKKTGDFALGAAQLFERDAFGADVMDGLCPQPKSPEDSAELFARSGAMLGEAFRHARALGVKTCVGTEIALTVPKALQDRLKALGKDPKDPAVRQELYEGIFRRIMQTYPLDYYWFWTPEDWTWQGEKPEQLKATLDDFAAAAAAAKKVKAPFTLATCGWVLGPKSDRALFDNVLPKDMPLSCINREVGKTPVEPGFANVTGRPKWAIPWMEDDPNLCAVQLWVGRMRKDAADALRYGCTGLLGIHWRTRVLGPNVSALAQAAWDQRGWSKPEAAPPPEPARVEGPDGGNNAAFAGNTIADTDEPTIYQTVRYGVAAYRLAMPNGKYAVTLKFSEPHYKEAGKRVFGVKVQGKPVIDKLDIFARVGQNKALDFTFPDVEVTNGWMDITFVPDVEFPSIAAIVVEGAAGKKKINCGGPAYKDYAADPPGAGPSAPKDRFLPTDDFYRDWATAEFGRDVADRAAAIFQKIDGHVPEATGWTDGPGGIRPNEKPIAEVLKAYAFVDELAALRPQVRGAGSLERFDYWLSNFRYMMAVEKVRCAWHAKDDAAMKAALAEVYQHLLPTVGTPGELGTVANWEQHNLPALKVDLPKTYTGPTRVIVPTRRTSLAPGEPLNLKVIVLSAQPPKSAAVRWRTMGTGEYADVPLTPLARGVYTAKLTPKDGADMEYYVEVTPAAGEAVRWPASAPAINQTVVITPEVK